MTERTPGTANLAYADSLWKDYKSDPESVPAKWREYFEQFERDQQMLPDESFYTAVGRKQLAQGHGPGGKVCAGCGRAAAMSLLQYNVSQLIRNYRVRGHRAAGFNPLDNDVPRLAELDPEYYGMIEEDQELLFNAGEISGTGPLKLRELIARLEETYCKAIGVQFMHIDDLSERQWLQDRMESSRNRISLDLEQQKRILRRLSDAVHFEQYLQKKFVGAKSFSLEGGESLIPLLDMAIEKAGEKGVEHVALGMPHRGRLNVLANIMGKKPSRIFGEFKDADAERDIGKGDVKYHLGFHRDWETSKGKSIHVDLLFNPSHLEFVGPVAQGSLRAWLDREENARDNAGLLVLMHGDAAVIGEGIVQETFNLSEIDGFSVGGTLHVVVNNQIGFTTLSSEARSSTYATDIAKMLQIPIFHVNGENPEAVAQALDLALDFRHEFHRDVVIDMYCYRRRGHNEGDEPSFTQPLMYKTIKGRPTVLQSYADHLLKIGELSKEETDKIQERSLVNLEKEFEEIAQTQGTKSPVYEISSAWQHYHGGPYLDAKNVDTSVPEDKLNSLMERLCQVPDGHKVHRKITKLLEARRQMVHGQRPLDWGAGEALALASIAQEGMRIRLSGQDSQRGTFSHRHSVLHDTDNGAVYMPLSYLSENQGRVSIINSPLSEGAVLGFEYGYSVVSPDALVIWEAQFGDFANVAQVYIDQFISSGEQKWQLPSGIVLLLPHGLEGTGPEHASARLERFLSLAAAGNYQVVNPTTPAQLFHLLRRQVLRTIRKPLIIMSPKSMLRHPEAVSPIGDLANGGFKEIIDDEGADKDKVKRVLLSSGKFYYDLKAARELLGRKDIAILRVEQLYPLPHELLENEIARYKDGTEVVWVQEEPLNMGAHSYFKLHYAEKLSVRWPVCSIGRPESASPATGSAASHRLEQQRLIEQAFGEIRDGRGTKC